MPELTAEQRIALYRYMRTTRLTEEKLVHLYRQGKVVGGLYRCLGQEATSVGSAFALSKGDVLGPLIRNLGSVLVMGFTPRDDLRAAHGQGDGAVRRQGRQPPSRHPGAGSGLGDLDARRARPRDGRHRARRAHAEEDARRDDLHRRRRDLDRRRSTRA